jgi:hypothetical protein
MNVSTVSAPHFCPKEDFLAVVENALCSCPSLSDRLTLLPHELPIVPVLSLYPENISFVTGDFV